MYLKQNKTEAFWCSMFAVVSLCLAIMTKTFPSITPDLTNGDIIFSTIAFGGSLMFGLMAIILAMPDSPKE